MSAKISITVELPRSGTSSDVSAATITCSAETDGGNPLYDAQEVEQALAKLSLNVVRHIAGARGDIRTQAPVLVDGRLRHG